METVPTRQRRRNLHGFRVLFIFVLDGRWGIIMEINQIEALATVLANRTGEQLVIASLAHEVTANEPTIKKWVSILKSLYYGLTVKP